MHRIVIIPAHRQALEDDAIILKGIIAIKIDLKDASAGRKVIQSKVDTRFIAKWRDLAGDIATNAGKTVTRTSGDKKGESQTNIKSMKEEDVSKTIEQEEAYPKKIGVEITAFKPDLTRTEKGPLDLAQHVLNKAGFTAVRMLRKSDNRSVARPGGATIVSGTDKYVTFNEQCKEPKAGTSPMCEAKDIRDLDPRQGRTRARGGKLQDRGRSVVRTARLSSSAVGLAQPHPKGP